MKPSASCCSENHSNFQLVVKYISLAPYPFFKALPQPASSEKTPKPSQPAVIITRAADG